VVNVDYFFEIAAKFLSASKQGKIQSYVKRLPSSSWSYIIVLTSNDFVSIFFGKQRDERKRSSLFYLLMILLREKEELMWLFFQQLRKV